MKYLKYVVITSINLVGLSSTTPAFAEELEALVHEQNEIYNVAILNEESYTEETLHELLGEPVEIEEIDNTTARQVFKLTNDEEAIELEVIADILIDAGEVINLTFNLHFTDIIYEDIDAFTDIYHEMIDEAVAMYNNQEVMTKDQIIEHLGEPSTLSIAGSYELLLYSVGPDDSSTDFVAVTLDDFVYALNEHSNEDIDLEKEFELSPAQLNQMSHTSGITLNDMYNKIGKPDSVFYDFPNAVITYVWYSDADDDFTEISYITDFRGVMVEIGHQLQAEQ